MVNAGMPDKVRIILARHAPDERNRYARLTKFII